MIDCVKEGLVIVLESSVSTYNGKLYISKSGSPRGGKASPDLIDIAHSYFLMV